MNLRTRLHFFYALMTSFLVAVGTVSSASEPGQMTRSACDNVLSARRVDPQVMVKAADWDPIIDKIVSQATRIPGEIMVQVVLSGNQQLRMDQIGQLYGRLSSIDKLSVEEVIRQESDSKFGTHSFFLLLRGQPIAMATALKFLKSSSFGFDSQLDPIWVPAVQGEPKVVTARPTVMAEMLVEDSIYAILQRFDENRKDNGVSAVAYQLELEDQILPGYLVDQESIQALIESEIKSSTGAQPLRKFRVVRRKLGQKGADQSADLVHHLEGVVNGVLRLELFDEESGSTSYAVSMSDYARIQRVKLQANRGPTPEQALRKQLFESLRNPAPASTRPAEARPAAPQPVGATKEDVTPRNQAAETREAFFLRNPNSSRKELIGSFNRFQMAGMMDLVTAYILGKLSQDERKMVLAEFDPTQFTEYSSARLSSMVGGIHSSRLTLNFLDLVDKAVGQRGQGPVGNLEQKGQIRALFARLGFPNQRVNLIEDPTPALPMPLLPLVTPAIQPVAAAADISDTAEPAQDLPRATAQMAAAPATTVMSVTQAAPELAAPEPAAAGGIAKHLFNVSKPAPIAARRITFSLTDNLRVITFLATQNSSYKEFVHHFTHLEEPGSLKRIYRTFMTQLNAAQQSKVRELLDEDSLEDRDGANLLASPVDPNAALRVLELLKAFDVALAVNEANQIKELEKAGNVRRLFTRLRLPDMVLDARDERLPSEVLNAAEQEQFKSMFGQISAVLTKYRDGKANDPNMGIDPDLLLAMEALEVHWMEYRQKVPGLRLHEAKLLEKKYFEKMYPTYKKLIRAAQDFLHPRGQTNSRHMTRSTLSSLKPKAN